MAVPIGKAAAAHVWLSRSLDDNSYYYTTAGLRHNSDAFSLDWGLRFNYNYKGDECVEKEVDIRQESDFLLVVGLIGRMLI
jgi:hypothetical protein